MKFLSLLCLSVALLASSLKFAVARKPLSTVQVTLRGKKYDIEDVTTVGELQERLSDVSGVDAEHQGRVLFNGKRLESSASLDTAGVSEGDQLNVVPGKVKSKRSSAKPNKVGKPAAKPPSSDLLQGILGNSEGGSNQLDDLLKGMGMGGGMGGGDGDSSAGLKESLEMMTNMMNSPLLQEYMKDPERLEQSRQMILQNPMLKGMMAGMPGMDEILNSPEAWREAMQAAASMYKSMDKEDLMAAMMGSAPGAGGLPGLFDGPGAGAGNNVDLSALDELSEGED